MRYFIGFLVTIGLIIILVIMLVGGGGKKAAVPTTNKVLYSYANSDAEVKFTADGPVNYDGSHKQVQIIVGRNSIQYNQVNGYNGQVVKGQSFPNNEEAYGNFLRALYHQGYSLGDTDATLKNEKGYCPQGNRYVFALQQGGKDLQRFWSTSCGKPETYKGNASITIELFQAQVPNLDNLDGDYDFF